MFGPLYYKKHEGRPSSRSASLEKHLNVRGIAHGGMLVTLADSALGIVLSMSRTPPQPMVTVSLTTDFVEAARLRRLARGARGHPARREAGSRSRTATSWWATDASCARAGCSR